MPQAKNGRKRNCAANWRRFSGKRTTVETGPFLGRLPELSNWRSCTLPEVGRRRRTFSGKEKAAVRKEIIQYVGLAKRKTIDERRRNFGGLLVRAAFS